jgi:hypothetical protein
MYREVPGDGEEMAVSGGEHARYSAASADR